MTTTAAMQVTQGETEIVVRRDFAAPPARVWSAMTTPELIRQWMWAYDYPMTECRIDPRPGGSFLYRWANAAGESFFFDGPILEVEPPHRMVHEERFNGDPASGSRVETRLEPTAAGTRMVMTIRYGSAEALAAAMATGMTDGMAETYDKLAALLDSGA